LVSFDDGAIIIEKNEVISISDNTKQDAATEKLNIDMNGLIITLEELTEKTRQKVGDSLYYRYDAFKNNCQFFIRYLLESVNLYSKQASDFLFQDVSDLIKHLPSYVKKISNVATKTGAYLNKVTGQGHNHPNQPAKPYHGSGKDNDSDEPTNEQLKKYIKILHKMLVL
jgi:hypothetical protein